MYPNTLIVGNFIQWTGHSDKKNKEKIWKLNSSLDQMLLTYLQNILLKQQRTHILNNSLWNFLWNKTYVSKQKSSKNYGKSETIICSLSDNNETWQAICSNTTPGKYTVISFLKTHYQMMKRLLKKYKEIKIIHIE